MNARYFIKLFLLNWSVQSRVTFLLRCLFRSGFSRKPAADSARSGDSDPDTSVADHVVPSAGLWTLSAPADDDVEPARAQSGVSADVHVDPRPAGRQ